MSNKVLTKEEFEALDPYNRGYAVYMMGARADQPNVPDEKNPYPPGSQQQLAWIRGMTAAVLDAQDSEE